MRFVKETFRAGKDKALAAAFRILVEEYTRKYGILSRIEIDSSQKSMEAEILLHGETEPVTLKIAGFEITSTGDDHHILPRGVSASRAWIDTLARDYLEDRAFRIPSPVAHALKALL